MVCMYVCMYGMHVCMGCMCVDFGCAYLDPQVGDQGLVCQLQVQRLSAIGAGRGQARDTEA